MTKVERLVTVKFRDLNISSGTSGLRARRIWNGKAIRARAPMASATKAIGSRHSRCWPKITTKSETWAQPGSVFAIGGWLLGLDLIPDVAAELRQPAPPTIAECKERAASWMLRLMDGVFRYRDPFRMAQETGNMPCAGYPLQVLTVTPTNHYREVIQCP